MKYIFLFLICLGCSNEQQTIALPSAELFSSGDQVNGSLFFNVYEDDLRDESICELVYTVEGEIEASCSNCISQRLYLDLYSDGDCGTRLRQLESMHWEVSYNNANNPIGTWKVLEGNGWNKWGEVSTSQTENGIILTFTPLFALFL